MSAYWYRAESMSIECDGPQLSVRVKERHYERDYVITPDKINIKLSALKVLKALHPTFDMVEFKDNLLKSDDVALREWIAFCWTLIDTRQEARINKEYESWNMVSESMQIGE